MHAAESTEWKERLSQRAQLVEGLSGFESAFLAKLLCSATGLLFLSGAMMKGLVCTMLKHKHHASDSAVNNFEFRVSHHCQSSDDIRVSREVCSKRY